MCGKSRVVKWHNTSQFITFEVKELILIGGLLIDSMVGLDNRATMDMDTAIRNYNLLTEDAKKMIEEIMAVPLDDGIQFVIKNVGSITGCDEVFVIRNTYREI